MILNFYIWRMACLNGSFGMVSFMKNKQSWRIDDHLLLCCCHLLGATIRSKLTVITSSSVCSFRRQFALSLTAHVYSRKFCCFWLGPFSCWMWQQHNISPHWLWTADIEVVMCSQNQNATLALWSILIGLQCIRATPVWFLLVKSFGIVRVFYKRKRHACSLKQFDWSIMPTINPVENIDLLYLRTFSE